MIKSFIKHLYYPESIAEVLDIITKSEIEINGGWYA